MYLYYDTETTGLPDWKEPSESEQQPHMVELAAILVDPDAREVIDSTYAVIRPDGWVIEQAMTDIHGISQERALEEGIPEADALDNFLALYDRCNIRIAHNTTFDNRIIRIAMHRYRPELVPEDKDADPWRDKTRYLCTLMNARKIIGGKSGHTLADCYQHFIGAPLVGNHSAMADTTACREIHEAMIDGGHL